MRYSVLIVEDDTGLRASFAHAVRGADDLILVGEASDLPEGRRLLDATRPNMLLVDIGLPSGSGLDLIRHANERLPDCDVMVVTVFGDEHHVLECIQAGATGYLLKGTQNLGIVEQIRALRRGGSPISPVIARQLLVRLSPIRTGPRPTQVLSVQECSVLELSSKGYRYEEIANMLGLSYNTVETYVKRIYRKLQVHSKTEAVYEARKLGLIHD